MSTTTPAEAAALVAAERETAKAYARTTTQEDSIHLSRVKLIGAAVVQGQTVRGIADVIGEEAARLSFPGASAADLVKLGKHAPFSVSKSTVDNYAGSAVLLSSAGVTQDKDTVSAAYKLVTRSGSSSMRADLAAGTVKLAPEARKAHFVAGVSAALLKLAKAKAVKPASKPVPAAVNRTPDSPVTTTPADEIVPQSVELLLQQLTDTLTELSARELTEEETAAVFAILAPYANVQA